MVGGGILGTLHAVEAHRRGWDVVQLDVDPEPQLATVRNIGELWVSGRAPGLELDVALRARELWLDLASRAPGMGFRAEGSITVATRTEHLAVFDEVLARDDAERRGFRFLPPDVLGENFPAVRGATLGALACSQDAVVEPRLTLPALRSMVGSSGTYEFLGGRQVWEVGPGQVVDTTGKVHRGDIVLVCPGARPSTLASMVLGRAPLRRVRLQMLQTAPLPERLGAILTDAEALRWNPGYDVPARALLPPAPPVVEEFQIHLRCAQRSSGALTVGETREFEEPFGFDLSERPFRHLTETLAALLGGPLPPITRRWDGVHHECTDGRLWYREAVDEGVFVVTGGGSRGLTLAPAIAEDTFAWIEEGIECGGARVPPAT